VHALAQFRLLNEALAQLSGGEGSDYAEASSDKIRFFNTAFPEPVLK